MCRACMDAGAAFVKLDFRELLHIRSAVCMDKSLPCLMCIQNEASVRLCTMCGTCFPEQIQRPRFAAEKQQERVQESSEEESEDSDEDLDLALALAMSTSRGSQA